MTPDESGGQGVDQNRGDPGLTEIERGNMREVHPVHGPIRADVVLPGSKEDTNRALILAALSDRTTQLRNVSVADDSLELMAALSTLGVALSLHDRTCHVTGTGGRFTPASTEIDAGKSGLTSRLLMALCTLVPGELTLVCGSRMRERPVLDLLTAIRQLGSTVTCLESEDHLPISYDSLPTPAITGGSLAMSGTTSSQFISALLLIAPRLRGGLEIEVLGDQVSQSYIDMTQTSLARFGIPMDNDAYRTYRVPEVAQFGVHEYDVECDATASTYFLALAAITGGTIRVHGLSPNSAQGDVHFAGILESMGCRVRVNAAESWIEVSGPQRLRSCTADLLASPDSAQTLAVIAAFAEGRTRITGLSTLRIKETDRLEALHRELTRMGVAVRVGEDWIEVDGGRPHGATIKTYDDHRMAMSFAIAGAVVDGLRIAGDHTVTKSFPEFWDTLTLAGVTSDRVAPHEPQASGVVSSVS